MEPLRWSDIEPSDSRMDEAIRTFTEVLGEVEFSPLEGERVPTLTRAKDFVLAGDKAIGVEELKKTLSFGEITTYNIWLYALIGDTGMAEMRYYFMEPTTRQMRVASVVLPHNENNDRTDSEIEERYASQIDDDATLADEKDWQDFFNLVQEVEEM
jgi:hypothetical protein